MWAGATGHRDVGAKARAQLDVFFETAEGRKILVVNARQLLPSAALRNNVRRGSSFLFMRYFPCFAFAVSS